MPNFKIVISDAKQSYQIEKDQSDCPLLGKKIDESFSAEFLGMDGYELKITGGSDKDGFPMRKDVEGMVRKNVVLKPGIGFLGEKGARRRKTVRGNTIGTDIVQINCIVTKKGSEPLEKLLGKKEEKEAPKEAGPETKEAPKEEKPAAPAPEKPKEAPAEKKEEKPEKKEVPKEEKPVEKPKDEKK